MDTYSNFYNVNIKILLSQTYEAFFIIICKPLCFQAPTDLLVLFNIFTLSVPDDN